MARTRSASAHQNVLRAAIDLVAERGIDATSMDAIALKSGVSKATIYKHWADKEALLLEMLAAVFGLEKRPPFDSGDTRADMAAVLAYRSQEDVEIGEKIKPHLMAYSATNPAFGQAWRHMVMEPPRRELRRLLDQGIERGELFSQLDPELCLALLLGPVIYWHVFLRRTAGDPMTLAEGIVDAFWRSFGVKERNLKRAPRGPSWAGSPRSGRKPAAASASVPRPAGRLPIPGRPTAPGPGTGRE
jgi:AcrR family transcriptional regulator